MLAFEGAIRSEWANGRSEMRRRESIGTDKLQRQNLHVYILAGNCRRSDLLFARHDVTPIYVKRIPISRICTITYVSHAILIIYRNLTCRHLPYGSSSRQSIRSEWPVGFFVPTISLPLCSSSKPRLTHCPVVS